MSRNEATNVAESTTNAGQPECASETSRPAPPVPSTDATTRPACEIEFAASRPDRGTTTETSVVRAGVKKVLTADSAKPRTNSNQTMSADCARMKPSTMAARNPSETSITRRGSSRSTQTPASGPIATAGTATTIAMNAIAANEPVRLLMTSNVASRVSESPKSEMNWAAAI